MKIAATLLLMAPVWAQVPAKPAAVVGSTDKPKVGSSTEGPNGPHGVMRDAEKRLDATLATIGSPEPVYILGLTRGLYLQGYGAVFTAELDLVQTTAPTPFNPVFTKEYMAKVHRQKVANLPLLKKAMQGMWQDAAATLNSIPDTEQVVLSIRMLYRPWEDTTGLPSQILLKGSRKGGLAAVQTEVE